MQPALCAGSRTCDSRAYRCVDWPCRPGIERGRQPDRRSRHPWRTANV